LCDLSNYYTGTLRCNACAVVDESFGSLQRCNSTSDLLDDHRRPPEVAPEVTSPNAGDFRSLRDAIVTTKVGGGSGYESRVTSARGAAAGSTGNLVDVDRTRRSPASSNAGPPPPPQTDRGVSTFSSFVDQQTPAWRSVHGRDSGASSRTSGEGSAERRRQSSNSDHRSGPVTAPGKVTTGKHGVEPTSTARLSKRVGSTENLADSGTGRSPAPMTAAPANAEQRRRFDVEETATSPVQRQHTAGSRAQRLLSDDLPPPPSPATLKAASTPANHVQVPAASHVCFVHGRRHRGFKGSTDPPV